jgi:hypothetical protein
LAIVIPLACSRTVAAAAFGIESSVFLSSFPPAHAANHRQISTLDIPESSLTRDETSMRTCTGLAWNPHARLDTVPLSD